jgi:peptidoglycan hydrolase CwlO-like protein
MQALTDKQHFDAIEAKVDKLDRRVDKLDLKVEKLDGRVGDLEVKVDKLDWRLGKLEVKVDNLERKVDDGFGALYRLMIQSFAGMGVTMILGFAALFLQNHL